MPNFAVPTRCKPVCDVSALQHYLSIPRTPMDLSTLGRMYATKVESGVVQQLVREMAIRTSRCYQTFSDPVILKTLHKPHAERLRWARTFVLREFNYCVALHRSVERMRCEGGFESSTNLSFERGECPSPTLSISRVRNTDDDSFICEPSFDSAGGEVHAAPPPTQSAAGPSPSPNDDIYRSGFLLHGSSTSKELTREEVESILESWKHGNVNIPLTTALKLLQPHQSLLDVMVNEAAVRSDELNGWFSRFCRRRVAWRVLHEHLLCLTLPSETQRVICNDTNIEELIQQAGNAVVEIFGSLVESGSVRSLELNVEEDARILTERPAGTLISSSVSPRSCPCEVGERQVPVPAVSSSIFSIEGHLHYIIREVLKNACAATLRQQPDIPVLVKYAVDDRCVVMDFVDHAGGIPPQHYKNIWKFGWTTSEHYESHLGGFGVGLPTSKVYMDMCGGSIELYSTRREGSTVRVRFPKAPVEILVPDSTLPPVLG